MYLLVDECCGKALVRYAEDAGHTAQRTVHVPGLGQQAPDADIYRFAVPSGAVIVTANGRDFLKLAGAGGPAHSGMIFTPPLPTAQLKPLFDQALTVAAALFTPGCGLVVEIHADGSIDSF